jgi:DNA-binding response OmpR family regulator
MGRNSALPLAGTRVLVVEDDSLIAMEIESVLAEAGAQVVGPFRTASEALPLAEKSLSAAVLDIRLQSGTVACVAQKLAELGIPFVFYTGQLKTDETMAEWSGHDVVQKPASAQMLIAAVAGLRAPQPPTC